LALALGVGACLVLAVWDRDACAAGAQRPTPAASRGPIATALPTIADRSLPDDRYVSLGLPSYDREWTGQDMTVAAALLQQLAAQHPEQLPRFRSRRSGKVFARIVAPENLRFLRDRSLPLGTRMPQELETLESSNAITKLYLAAFSASAVAGDDLIELLGIELRESQVLVELIDELVPTLSRQDPKYQVRMAGLDQTRRGLAQVVAGAITSLTEEQSYTLGARGRLLDYCLETFPRIVPELSAASQTEVLRRLDGLAAEPRLRELRPQLVTLRDAVHAATKPGGRR
ncbi:MAG TPA: hypothetical protein VOA80_16050, partial [Thermoanaerobaculia bacterium]|nr:hypothetical protein [Thermoanaerobaculia bacterium]